MKNVLRVVVTGGPCGGKTSGLDAITNYFRSAGYTVYIVNEVATELINGGMRPFGDHSLSGMNFQRLIVQSQLFKERVRQEAAKMCDNDKIVILYDRGILDGKAYVTQEEFDALLKEFNLSEADVLSRYDLVIHMVTAAVGKEEYYTLANNSARTETVEEARIGDSKTMQAWKNHMNQKIVNNDTLFDEKLQKVINIIRAYLGEDEIIKREVYVVNEEDIDFAELKKYDLVQEDVEEFVKMYDNEKDEIFSMSTINGSSYFTHIIYNYSKDGSVTRVCHNISEDEYFLNLQIAKSKVIKKTCFNIIFDSERYRLNIYERVRGRQYILERGVTKNGSNQLPNFIKNATDVTNDRDYCEDSICIDELIDSMMK